VTLYNLCSGGVQRCSGQTKAGTQCKNQGYTVDRGYGYWCPHHKDQEKR
jgi:hypothetical protein